MKKPIVSEISFRIDSGSKFAICGKGGSGKGTVLAGIARTLLPVPNADGKTGTIKVGQVDTKTIGRKCT
jgi:ABC-type molybdenum transport system ATPase subunit/photorepair protein PhrA